MAIAAIVPLAVIVRIAAVAVVTGVAGVLRRAMWRLVAIRLDARAVNVARAVIVVAIAIVVVFAMCWMSRAAAQTALTVAVRRELQLLITTAGTRRLRLAIVAALHLTAVMMFHTAVPSLLLLLMLLLTAVVTEPVNTAAHVFRLELSVDITADAAAGAAVLGLGVTGEPRHRSTTRLHISLCI